MPSVSGNTYNTDKQADGEPSCSCKYCVYNGLWFYSTRVFEQWLNLKKRLISVNW
jgi:hypothetical protein